MELSSRDWLCLATTQGDIVPPSMEIAMSYTINTKAIHAAVTDALHHAAAYGVRVADLKRLLSGVPREQAQDVITPAIGNVYGVGVKTGTKGLTFEGGRAKGAKSGSAAYECAKKARTRLLQDVYGKSERAEAAPVVQRFNKAKVEAIQQAIAGMSKAEARAYFDKALAAAFA